MADKSEYTAKLSQLVKDHKDVAAFIELYQNTFEETPNNAAVMSYLERTSVISDYLDENSYSY